MGGGDPSGDKGNAVVLTTQVQAWGPKLIMAERAFAGGKAAQVTKANEALVAVSAQIGDAATEVGSFSLNRGNANALRGVAALVDEAASLGKADADRAIWNLRTAGEDLRSLVRTLEPESRGGAASFGGGATSFGGAGGGGAASL